MAKPGHDSNLDVLRSVAVLAVFLSHALQVLAGCTLGASFAYGVDTFSLDRIGVLLFFVHTSLVLMQFLERTRTTLAGWPLARYFYIRRAFRIYPLSVCLILLCIAFSVPAYALGVPDRWDGWRWLAANLLLIQNVVRVDAVSSPLWSLPFEVQMYLILPLLFLLVRDPGGGRRLVPGFIVAAVLSVLSPVFLYAPCFLAGVIAYKLLGTVRPRLPAWLWLPAVIGAAAFYVSIPHSDASWLWLKDVSICVIVGASIPLFGRNRGPIAAAASHIAKYSYCIYLCHAPVLWLVYCKLTIPGWQRPVWLVIGTGVVSVACYYAIEAPLIQVGTRLAIGMSVKPRAPAEAAA